MELKYSFQHIATQAHFLCMHRGIGKLRPICVCGREIEKCLYTHVDLDFVHLIVLTFVYTSEAVRLFHIVPRCSTRCSAKRIRLYSCQRSGPL